MIKRQRYTDFYISVFKVLDEIASKLGNLVCNRSYNDIISNYQYFRNEKNKHTSSGYR